MDSGTLQDTQPSLRRTAFLTQLSAKGLPSNARSSELQAAKMSRVVRVFPSQDAKMRRKLSDGLTVALNCCSEAARFFFLIRLGAATIHTGHTSDTDIIKENTAYWEHGSQYRKVTNN